MVMGVGMEVLISVSLFPINLVGEGAIGEARDEDIQA
jgi:hypothetical protein